MKIILCGYGRLSVHILDMLLRWDHEVSVMPISADRGSYIWCPSLLGNARLYHLPVLKKIEQTDIIISAHYDKIIKKNELELCKYAINIHYSLLPKYRGCYPIHWAIINGDTKTGATMHYIDEGIDTGDIISQTEIPISEKDTSGTLYETLTDKAIDMFGKIMPHVFNNKIKPFPQSEIPVFPSYYSRREPFDRTISFWWDNETKDRFRRAFTFPPFKGAIEENEGCDCITPEIKNELINMSVIPICQKCQKPIM